jgi:5-(carboxyamino)imidazole ribonucleotide synthase
MKQIYPPATIGIIGGGQLGKMLTFAAKKMGYHVIILDPTPSSPAGQVADEQITAPFNDLEAAIRLAKSCDVLTYEFENVDADIVEHLERNFQVHPTSHVLRITQNRLKEKETLTALGIPVTQFRSVNNETDLNEAVDDIGLPAVVKTIRGGYDGKGQIVLKDPEDLEKVHSPKELIFESFVPFIKEISCICVRSIREVKTFPISENIHRNNILYMSIVPARISKEEAHHAAKIAKRVVEGLKGVGAFGIEMFLLEDGTILVNEIAPRVHNSGHYTIEACYTSQFEQHIRAICGLPLGEVKLLSPVVMVNILGEGIKRSALKGIDEVLAVPGTNLHLYGKREARPGRKMGHITVLAPSLKEAIERAERAHSLLRWEQ